LLAARGRIDGKAKAKEEADPCGMTDGKAKARAREEADSQRE
jgi:hypothetical protein